MQVLLPMPSLPCKLKVTTNKAALLKRYDVIDVILITILIISVHNFTTT